MSDASLVNEVQQSGDIASVASACDGDGQQECNQKKEESAVVEKPELAKDQSPPRLETGGNPIEPAQRIVQVVKVQNIETTTEKKKNNDDDKSAIYKALAIKLKKELVKTRDELSKLQEEYKRMVEELKKKVESLETTLESERVLSTNMTTTLEATVKNLKSQLATCENDLQTLQTEFDNYKTRATKIMQQNNPLLSNSNKSFEEDRYKQLKALSEEQKRQIKELNTQVSEISYKNLELEQQIETLTNQLSSAQVHIESYRLIENKYNNMSVEHENLKSALKQYKEKHQSANYSSNEYHTSASKPNNRASNKLTSEPVDGESPIFHTTKPPSDFERLPTSNDDENVNHISPSASDKDDNQTNSSSSFDSSTYGYVHIKPTAFEIVSRSSVLEDAQKQIDNLTKAYLDSESTNSLLTEQVCALKEEIRRIQRGNERMELANNLEYLKNVIFKFLSLDNGQVEQKQRLVPVLSTILKLSPEETSKLNSLALAEKGGITSSFFKL